MTLEVPGINAIALKPLPLSELTGGDELLQGEFWGRFKESAGWRPMGFTWKMEPEEGRILVLQRQLPGGLQMAYVPHGPDIPWGLETSGISEFLKSIAEALRPYLSARCFMIRFDLTGGTRGPVESPSEVPKASPLENPLRGASQRIQPPDTVILPLDRSEDELLKGMHKKTRYNIRLAARKGVNIRRYQDIQALETLAQWYQIYWETARRDGILLHEEAYYTRLFEGIASSTDSPSFSLYIAEHEGEPLAGIIVSLYGRRATYMYGASRDVKRELMPNHLLQWQAIKDARTEGAREYDFFGVPPSNDSSHPMHGLWRFKTGFGGDLLHYYGAWDYPMKPLVYQLYRWAEAHRSWRASRRKPCR